MERSHNTFLAQEEVEKLTLWLLTAIWISGSSNCNPKEQAWQPEKDALNMRQRGNTTYLLLFIKVILFPMENFASFQK